MLGKGNVGRPDTPGVSTAEMQRIMDELPREVLAPAFNELAGQLEAETAAADIGAAAPEGVTAAPAGKLQAVLNGLRDLVKAHTDRADNPHGVTAAQAGAYSKAETDAAISAKVVELGAGDMAKSIYDPGNEQQPLLPRNGDGSNVTASFTEAEQDADIQTGEELTVLFGKIKKRFSTYDADGDGVVDRAAAADRVAKKFILQNNAGQQMAEFDGRQDGTAYARPGGGRTRLHEKQRLQQELWFSGGHRMPRQRRQAFQCAAGQQYINEPVRHHADNQLFVRR